MTMGLNHELRRLGIGASEIAAVCGVHPHMKAIDVYCRKAQDAPDDFDGNDATEWGHVIEPMLAQWYTRTTGIELVQGKTVRSTEHPIVVATPDYIYADGSCLVQCKNVGLHVAWHWSAVEVAEYVALQEAWEMLATGIHQAKVVACIGGLAPAIYDVEWNEDRAMVMLELAERFWREHVEPRIPPPPDGSDAYREFLARRFPSDSGPTLRATDEVIELAEQYDAARAAVGLYEDRKSEVGNKLRALCGDSAGFWWNDGKVTWKRSAKGSRTLNVRLKNIKGERCAA